MTLSEFKAWFEGYTEGLEGAPTKAQFDRIKEKVKEISGTPITYPVYIDHYWEPYRRYVHSWSSSGGIGVGGLATSASNDLKATYASNSAYADKGYDVTKTFDSHAAMYALGKAEALAA